MVVMYLHLGSFAVRVLIVKSKSRRFKTDSYPGFDAKISRCYKPATKAARGRPSNQNHLLLTSYSSGAEPGVFPRIRTARLTCILQLHIDHFSLRTGYALVYGSPVHGVVINSGPLECVCDCISGDNDASP